VSNIQDRYEMMGKELQLSQSVNETISLINKKRAKSIARVRKSVEKRIEVDPYEPVNKFNLAPEYQHVRSQFMDTSKTVNKLRQQAKEQRE